MAESCQIDTFAQGIWLLRSSIVLLLAALGQYSGLIYHSKKNKPLEVEMVQVQEAEAVPVQTKAEKPAAPPLTDPENQTFDQKPIRFQRGKAVKVAQLRGDLPPIGMIAGTALRERRSRAAPFENDRAIRSQSVVVKMPEDGIQHVSF